MHCVGSCWTRERCDARVMRGTWTSGNLRRALSRSFVEAKKKHFILNMLSQPCLFKHSGPFRMKRQLVNQGNRCPDPPNNLSGYQSAVTTPSSNPNQSGSRIHEEALSVVARSCFVSRRPPQSAGQPWTKSHPKLSPQTERVLRASL